jgi:hypothetical protein
MVDCYIFSTKVADDADFDKVAIKTPGYTYDDINFLINIASKFAISRFV